MKDIKMAQLPENTCPLCDKAEMKKLESELKKLRKEKTCQEK